MDRLEEIKKEYSYYFRKHAKTERDREYLKSVKWLISEIERLKEIIEKKDLAIKANRTSNQYKIERLQKALKEIGDRCYRHTAEINGIDAFTQGIWDLTREALKD